MRAVLYPRVSSLIQKDRHTIASQLHELPLYVESKGWDLVRPADYYVDDGRSAKTGKLAQRTNFLKLLDDCQRTPRPFDVVVVIDAKRLTRTESWRERGLILGSLQDAGVKVAIAASDQVLDLNTDEGDLLMGLETHFAAKDNRSRRESIIRGRDQAIRNGKKPSGPTPFGYLYDRATGTWSVDPELGPIVREIFERVAGGETCEAIARDLEARSVPRARPSKTKKRQPGRWNRERVNQVARATTYRGSWVAHKTKGLSVPIPVIIEDDVFSRAEDALLRHGRRGMTRVRHAYLAQGIARCGICGSLMGTCSTSSGTVNKKRLFYYTCSRRRRPENHPRCSLPMKRADDLDEQLWSTLSQALMRPDLLEKVLAASDEDESREGVDWAKDLQEFTRKLNRLDQTDGVILERFRRGLISSTTMDRHLDSSSRERALLERQIATASRQADNAKVQREHVRALRATAETLAARIATASLAERREIVHTLVPGRDDNWIVIDSETVRATILLAPAAQSTSATAFAKVGAAG